MHVDQYKSLRILMNYNFKFSSNFEFWNLSYIQWYINKFWFFLDINSGYEKEYKRTAGVDSRYFFASSYSNLSSIESDVISAITSCPVPQPVTTTDGSLMFADVCKYYVNRNFGWFFRISYPLWRNG